MNKILGIDPLKKFIFGVAAFVMLFWQLNTTVANATELREADRTVNLSETETVVLSDQQIAKGLRVFIDTCSQCHNTGRTKSNPNVTLGLDDLKGADPRRDNILAMVDYLKNPTSYDGEYDLLQLHPNTTRADIWSSMRNYNEEDLQNVSGYVLVQAQVLGEGWGGGKLFN
ncbi:photosystem II cytochrome c-550 [[Limnothrix rosea] IAM M-220]|uniref:photosystem II cytochrome c-550 n=1 Tax=[Limnothrix rosea] IAM M-220 TaxID=454133 RepID=UPI00095A7AEB|nr:photosystem II cytochrome c-550 [[Limnothrix rosea] IAM M-220]OKH16944.1 cytochrome c-550 [[Limnothrix rosea] IAM M-220]